jgi:hypothetical protein
MQRKGYTRVSLAIALVAAAGLGYIAYLQYELAKVDSIIAETIVGAHNAAQACKLKRVGNKIVELCTKYKQELRCYPFYTTGLYRYSPRRIHWDEGREWHGFEGHFPNYYYTHSPYSGVGHKRYSKTEYDEARKEIVAAYKAILDIIKPEIKDSMSKKYHILETQKIISTSQSKIKHFNKKININQSLINSYKSIIEKESANLIKLQEEVIAQKMADV